MCGIAIIRLRKPLDYYKQKYGTDHYALNKLYLMMEKQHNRGQEGAGIACVNLDPEPGTEYMFREKAEGKDAIASAFQSAVNNPLFTGHIYMGHLRYSTTSKKGLTYVHPFLRRNNWRAKNLCLCGNFNMTNIDEVFSFLTYHGQYPRIYGDGYIMLELMGHRLDREAERNYVEAREQGLTPPEITQYIDDHMDMKRVLNTTMTHFDGGYAVCGLTGSGEMFTMRDPNGIRPAYYYIDDEIVAIASERPVLQTTFDLESEQVHELQSGQALIMNRGGEIRFEQIIEEGVKTACSFERIYFSRGNDRDIHRERKLLGATLRAQILKAVDGDLENTVVSYIPNTAEVAYYGLVEALRELNPGLKTEKVLWKDIKLRTFITEDDSRNDLAAHVYDITSGSVRAGVDNLVIIDDSIVRGTTLRESIIKILDRLKPKKIVIVSSAPQIRFPDFYGIDMPRIGDLVAFQARISLLKKRGLSHIMAQVYHECKDHPEVVRQLYKPFTVEEINREIVNILRPQGVTTPIEIVYQSIEGLHEAIPNHLGDWYFTGKYPTPGGMKQMANSFINYMQKQENSMLSF